MYHMYQYVSIFLESETSVRRMFYEIKTFKASSWYWLSLRGVRILKKLTTLATCSRTGLYYTGITTHAFIQTRQPQTGRCINVCTLRVDECCKTHSTIIVNIHRMTEKSELRKQELHKVGHPLWKWHTCNCKIVFLEAVLN